LQQNQPKQTLCSSVLIQNMPFKCPLERNLEKNRVNILSKRLKRLILEANKTLFICISLILAKIKYNLTGYNF